MVKNLKKEISLALAELGAIKFGRFKLTSGKESSYYIDLRLVPSHPKTFRRIVRVYVEEAKKIGLKRFDAVAGIPTSGMVYASVLAYTLKKPFLYVRKEPKSWGEKRRIEGVLNRDARVLVVDDLITTGKSLVEAVDCVREEGGMVTDALVLIDREEGGEKSLRDKGVRLHSFLRIREVLGFLVKAGKINISQYEEAIRQVKT
ncbi:MAG: orotate phosphoribosyltransferase [Candidatus Hecatellales archaeon]|nr:MAG: orotate phosphoribosyltransferase [Candidatus Hecatellales archaeon]